MLLWPLAYSIIFSVLSGPIGSLILWRRMVFFGETIAHASLLGFLLQYLFGWPLEISMTVVSILYCLLLEGIQNQELDESSFLPMLSYGLMGISLVCIEKIVANPALLYTVFFGDILLVSSYDCLVVLVLLMFVFTALYVFFKPLLLILYSKDLAHVHYKSTRRMNFMLNVLIAMSVSISVQAVGMLLAMAMLTIPALTAYYCSTSPGKMIVNSCLLACAFSITGFAIGWNSNLALGPTISIVALVGHFVVRYFYWRKKVPR